MEDDVKEKLDKLKDIEVSSKRQLTGGLYYTIAGIGLIMSLFHAYVLLFRALDPWLFRSTHLVMGGLLLFAVVPGWERASRVRPHPVDYLFMAALIAPFVYVFSDLESVIYRLGVDPTGMDVLMSVIIILVILEMTRRVAGLGLLITVLCFIAYGYFGYYLPGILHHKGFSLSRLLTFVFTVEGILGIPIFASATYVFLFILFGAFLDASGAGRFFVDFARSVAGSRRGGPGKVSIVSSSLIGTVSGSAVANVVVDGVFNIPMMKASGFSPRVAAAIEAMTSTAGQLVPPVMGTAAFIMAELIGVSYGAVCLAAIIPSALYYIAGYFMIDFYAGKTGLKGLPRSELPSFFRLVAAKGFLLIPLAVLIFCLMVIQMSPFRAVMWAVLVLIGISLFNAREERLGLGKILHVLCIGPQGVVEIVTTCAAAGIIVGVVSLTGLGVKFAMVVISYSHGSLLLALFLTMLITIILGMGLPTTASYTIAASMLAPALVKLGVPPLPAHLFIFYFACLSALTPPVAAAAYAAGAIAKASLWEVGWTSTKFALAGFVVPYMFVYGNALILMGGWVAIGTALFSAILGTILLAGAVQGWFMKIGNLNYIERLFFLGASLLLLKPGWMTDLIGLLVIAALFLFRWIRARKPSGAIVGVGSN